MVMLPPMAPSPVLLPCAPLPSFHAICQDLGASKKKNQEQPAQPAAARHHYRATSVPSRLPSQQEASWRHIASDRAKEDRLSMDILLKAIALDQKMSAKYKKERVKNYVREQQWLHRTRRHAWPPAHISKPGAAIDGSRRRSRSAPGAPLAHYYHQELARNATRWYLPARTSHAADKDIAKAVVEQHLQSVLYHTK
ncbi:hypothetical protein BC940DRAFT_298848 [Gongronella butleri]|nr:hypothetical protein BC940DRAFT_298848 [Gongronella butleri]